MSLVLMDVDGTLLPPPSSEARFITHLGLRGKLGPVQITYALAFFAIYGPQFRRHVGRKNKAYLHNLSRARVAQLGADFVQQRLLPALRPALLERLRQHQQRGDRVALLTGAPDFLAAPLADALGVSRWCATQCAVRGTRFHWRPPVRHPLAANKVAAAQELCRQEQVALADTTAYADSIHDLALLERVAHPVAVYPDRKLAAIARARGWERIDRSGTRSAVGVSDGNAAPPN